VHALQEEIRARAGDVKADWMLKQRNAVCFPNLQIADQIVPQLRVFRPIAVDLTELRSFVLAPIGEPAALRAQRLRTFEDFINPCGFATPDDVAMFNESQANFAGVAPEWLQASERGISALREGAGDLGSQLGLRPLRATRGRFEMQPETGTHAMLREWARLLQAGLAERKHRPGEA
jgi:benzoate/toluate 1,2-dioxygenase alpha subunit